MDITTILDDLTGVATGYVDGGISVAVKTNYTPAIKVYSGGAASGASGGSGASGSSGSGFSLSKIIGLQVGVTVTDATGRILATYGPNNGAPPTDWLRVLIALAVVGLLGLGVIILVRAI